MKFFIVATTVDQAGPPNSTAIGGNRWARWVDPSVGRAWVNAKPGRTLEAVLDIGDPQLPTWAMLERLASLTAADLAEYTDDQLAVIPDALMRSPAAADGGRYSAAAVAAVREEYERRGLVV